MRYNLTLKDHFLVFIGTALLKTIYLTCRKQIEISPEAQDAISNNKKIIVAFWHGNQLTLPFVYSYCKRKFHDFQFTMLISAHRDGRLIATAIKKFGISSVAGSSSRGAVTAARQLLEILKPNSMIGITPDGPRGPRYEIKPGIFRIAEQSEALIIPVAVEARSAWRFNSWDKMLLPKPFSKINIKILSPINIAFNSNQSNAEEALTKALGK